MLERLANQYEDRTEFDVEPGTMDPRALCRAIDDVIPQTMAICGGSGASSGFATMNLTQPRPFYHTAQFFGCIGQMLPAAMGIIAASGMKPLVLIDGDASTMMHLSDFDTAVRYKMPLLVVVQNDQALGSEYHKMKAHKMDAELSTIPTPDMGGDRARVRRPRHARDDGGAGARRGRGMGEGSRADDHRLLASRATC